MMLAVILLLLIVLFVLPFVPGIWEFRKRQDAAPLFVSMDYHKYPRYFASSFRKKLIDSLNDPHAAEGHRELQLSKREQVQIIDQADFPPGTSVEHILYVSRDLASGDSVALRKEVYVRGSARIGPRNRLQALAADGDISIGRGTRFLRWLDAEGSVHADEACRLGIDAACGGAFAIGRFCSFMRLFGLPVQAGELPAGDDEARDRAGAVEVQVPSDSIERNPASIPPLSLKSASIISAESLTVGDYSVIRGHIKAHRDLVLGTHVTVTGNLFAEGSIEIGADSMIFGTIFSQQRVVIRASAQIGTKDRIKSVIGKKGVVLEQGARVYGLVMTEGKGLIA